VTWTERVGECRIIALIVKMSNRKNRERDGASALSGRHLVKRRNNQLIVDVSGGGVHRRGDTTGAEFAGGRHAIVLAIELINKN
jgi:hypothetical protein